MQPDKNLTPFGIALKGFLLRAYDSRPLVRHSELKRRVANLKNERDQMIDGLHVFACHLNGREDQLRPLSSKVPA